MPARFFSYAPLTIALVMGAAACSSPSQKAGGLPETRVSTIGVNSYLWRASLETVGFMPLLQTDANSGVILSDWYANPKTPGERIKLSVFIVDRDLRADAVRVNVQRQEWRDTAWVDASVSAGTGQKLEDVILVRARQIRQASLKN